METQEPIIGLSKQYDTPDFKVFKVQCTCGSDFHDHDVIVSADETGAVSVEVCAKLVSPYQRKFIRYTESNFTYRLSLIVNGIYSRLSLFWTVLTKGYVESSTIITMTPQQAHNYAEHLKKSIAEIEEFIQHERTNDKRSRSNKNQTNQNQDSSKTE